MRHPLCLNMCVYVRPRIREENYLEFYARAIPSIQKIYRIRCRSGSDVDQLIRCRSDVDQLNDLARVMPCVHMIKNKHLRHLDICASLDI